MGFIINPYQFGVAFTGILDTYSGAAAAYSAARRLSSTYTGNLIRVRRSSDNTEQNIGYDTNNVLDTSALSTFCSGTNGFVTTWYDQSGNTRNVTQSTAANQPKIYDSVTGVLTENSKPTIKFDGSNDFFSGGDILDLGTNSFLGVAYANMMATNATLYAKSVAAGQPNRYAYISDSGTYYGILSEDSGTSQSITYTASASERLYTQEIIRGTSHKIYFNGSQVASDTSIGNYNINSTYRFLVGAYGDANDTPSLELLFLNGNMSELIVYLSDQSSNRTGIEGNVNTYYSIY